jgi:hypothetical protein
MTIQFCKIDNFYTVNSIKGTRNIRFPVEVKHFCFVCTKKKSQLLCQNWDTEMYLHFLTPAENYRIFFFGSLQYLRYLLFCTAFCCCWRYILALKFWISYLTITYIVGNFQCYSVLKPTFLSVMMQPGPCGRFFKISQEAYASLTGWCSVIIQGK